MSTIDEKQTDQAVNESNQLKNLLSKVDDDEIQTFNRDVLGSLFLEPGVKKPRPSNSKMGKNYINKVFGETKNPKEIRNNYFVIEPEKNKGDFLDADDKIYMEQHYAKSKTENSTVAAKQQQATAKLAREWMTHAGEPESAKNTGNPNSK